MAILAQTVSVRRPYIFGPKFSIKEIFETDKVIVFVLLLLNLFFVCHIYGRLDGSLKQRPKNNVDWQISRKARSRGTTEWWRGWIWQNPVCQESNDLLCTFYHFVLSLTRFTIERMPISNAYWKVMVMTPSTVGLHTFYMISYYV